MSKRGASRAGEGRTRHAQGFRVVPAEGNQGAFKVSPAALLRQPDLALACRWVTRGGGDCTSGAPGAHARRTAPRPAAATICGASGEVAAVSGEAVVLARRRGEGGSERREWSVMWGAAPPAPAPEGRADGAGREGSAGRAPGCPHLRVGPPRREGAGCVSSFTLCAARRRPRRRLGRFVLAGRGTDGPGGVGGGPQSVCLPSRASRTHPPELLRAVCGWLWPIGHG